VVIAGANTGAVEVVEAGAWPPPPPQPLARTIRPPHSHPNLSLAIILIPRLDPVMFFAVGYMNLQCQPTARNDNPRPEIFTLFEVGSMDEGRAGGVRSDKTLGYRHL
jgi:hypothetical protein